MGPVPLRRPLPSTLSRYPSLRQWPSARATRSHGHPAKRAGTYIAHQAQWGPCIIRVSCNEEYASDLRQGLNDEVVSVVAQTEALVLQKPTERALERPAVSAQSRAMRPSALVDEGLDLAGAEELT